MLPQEPQIDHQDHTHTVGAIAASVLAGLVLWYLIITAALYISSGGIQPQASPQIMTTQERP